MRPGRELDVQIAKEVFGYNVWAKAKVLYESAPLGERPLRAYSRDMEWAWEVAAQMKISLIPIEGGQWFAFAGTVVGWKSPAEFIKYLQSGDFVDAGAALGESAPLAICIAAIKAAEKRKQADNSSALSANEAAQNEAANAALGGEHPGTTH
jgi:hypothetical protein